VILSDAVSGVIKLSRRVMIRLQELGAVGARARVGHAERALAVVPERRDELVLELAAVDGRAAATGTGGVTTLDHEALDDAVEDDVVVLAGCGEGGKVLAGLREI
jgi:predicted transcriptional regulator